MKFFRNFKTKLWDQNFLTFLGIVVSLITVLVAYCNDKNEREDAFKKKIMLEINELYANSNVLKSSWFAFIKFSESGSLDSIDENIIAFYHASFEKTKINLQNVKDLLKNDIYINLVKSKDLFEILSLMNSLDLNLINLQIYKGEPITKEQINTLDKVISFEFYLATALRKAYQINMDKNHLKGFLYFDNSMRSAYLLDYKRIILIRNFEDGSRIEVMKK